MVDGELSLLRLGRDVEGDVARVEIVHRQIEAARLGVDRHPIERLREVEPQAGRLPADPRAAREAPVREDRVDGIGGVIDARLQIDALVLRRGRDAVDAREHATARGARRARDDARRVQADAVRIVGGRRDAIETRALDRQHDAVLLAQDA